MKKNTVLICSFVNNSVLLHRMTESERIVTPLLAQMPPITLEEMSAVKLMKRNDTKYVTNFDTLCDLLRLAHDAGYFVQDISGNRISHYHTLYWDMPEDHRYYLIHQQKRKPRIKVRCREYIDSHIGFLEIKRKDNHGKTHKRRVKVPVGLESLVASAKEREDFLTEELHLTFDQLIPTLSNRFCRITMVNSAHTERVTIDFELGFHNYENHVRKQMPGIVIIELKRDGRTASPMPGLLRQLRIKPSGFSKYVIGSAHTNPELRQNLLKKRLRYYDKVLNRQQAPQQ